MYTQYSNYSYYLLSYVLCSAIVMTYSCEKHIVVVIPSYNNAPWCEQNIDSACMQQYHNYDVIYINDASTDDTGNRVEAHIRKQGYRNISIIHNDYNRKALANLYRVIHQCDDRDLIVVLDGDDFFANDHVLARINNIFSQQDIWAAYAQYINVPEEKAHELKLSVVGYARPTPDSMFEQRNFRTNKVWLWSGCRSFYAWFFKLIKFEDCILPIGSYKGKCFPTSYDAAIWWPFLEIGGRRVRFIDEILLHRNVATPLNDFKVSQDLQRLCGSVLVNNPMYDQLSVPIIDRLEHLGNAKVDVIVCTDSIDQQQCDSIGARLHGVSGLCLTHAEHNLRETLTASTNNYVLFLDPSMAFSRPIDLIACIELLEKTYAHSFHLNVSLADFGYPALSEQKLPCEQLWDDVYAWRFSCAPTIVTDKNCMHNVLYRKQDALALLDQQTWIMPPRAVGLFFKEAPCR